MELCLLDAVRADVLVRDELARLCLLALALERPGMLEAAAEAGALERLAEVLADGRG